MTSKFKAGMSAYPEDYQKKVLEDIEKNIGLESSVNSSLLRRMVTKKVSINKIHPNPKDEFSDPKIGPNFSIVSDYVNKISMAQNRGEAVFKEPLIVERIATGGYMLLNGHHRWLAAMRVGIKRVPVQLVNVIQDDVIINALKGSKNKLCASFDFDEVMITDGQDVKADRKLIWPFNRIYKKTFRKNIPILINELRDMGFDVWIYTGDFHSMEYINMLLKLHNTKVDGIVNGLTKKTSGKKLQEIFAGNYNLSVHIDNDSVICVDTVSKEYEMKDVESDSDSWASDIMLNLKEMDKIKALAGENIGE